MVDEPTPEAPRHVTSGQLFMLQRAAGSIVATLGRVKKKDWTDGERHLYKRCEETLAVIVQAETGKPPE